MRFPRIIAITFALLAAMAASAQTSTYTVQPGICGTYNSATYYCPTMHIVKADGSVYPFFYEPFYNGRLDYVAFEDNSGHVGLDGLGLMNVTTVTTMFDGSFYHQTTTFNGPDSSGTTVNGVVSITYTTYRGYHSGVGAGWRTYWRIIEGTVKATRVDY